MEYLEGGELLELVQQRGRLPEEEARDYFSQICEAMYYCHREKLIHRDLKLENILLSSKTSRLVKVPLLYLACTNLFSDCRFWHSWS